ncbi:MAG: hypothetical protein CYG60_04715 [Actinobacteria bacterium]|nr:MAG: hypothetical protein CYG60_04715 [Actinomycetota bacterium]
MGGKGSGRRPGNTNGRGRPTTDELPALDVRYLRRIGVISDPSQERVGGGPNRLPWIPLSWTRCNFGGQRPWFSCPGSGCGRRVAILYGPTLPLLCRVCRGLAYASQRRPEA